MSSDWNWSLDKKIPSDTSEARTLLDELLARLGEVSWPEEDKFGIHLAVEEALMKFLPA